MSCILPLFSYQLDNEFWQLLVTVSCNWIFGCWKLGYQTVPKGAKCKITTSFRPTSRRGLSFFIVFSKIWIFWNIHKAVPFLLYTNIVQCISQHKIFNFQLTHGRIGGSGGGGVQPTLWGFFWVFTWMKKQQHLTLLIAVRLSLARIAMISFYGSEIWRHK